MDQSPVYGESLYKVKDNNRDDNDNFSKKCPPAKVLWYFPRFKRSFSNENDTQNIRWNIDERKYDGNIRHVANSL